MAAIITAVATILAFGLNVAFNHLFLPKIQKKRDKKGVLDKFGYPLTRVVRSNVVYLRMFLDNLDKGWVTSDTDEYFRLSLLYTIGEFFGWWRMIESNAYLEFAERNTDRSNLYHKGIRVFKAMNSFAYFSEISEPDKIRIEKTTIPRRAAQAMGEMMIADSQESLIDFNDFCERFQNEKKFQKWFQYALRVFEKAESAKDPDALERIELVLCAMEIFNQNLLMLIEAKGSNVSELELFAHQHIRASVKQRFLYNYRKENFRVRVGDLISDSVSPSDETQMRLQLDRQ